MLYVFVVMFVLLCLVDNFNIVFMWERVSSYSFKRVDVASRLCLVFWIVFYGFFSVFWLVLMSWCVLVNVFFVFWDVCVLSLDLSFLSKLMISSIVLFEVLFEEFIVENVILCFWLFLSFFCIFLFIFSSVEFNCLIFLARLRVFASSTVFLTNLIVCLMIRV